MGNNNSVVYQDLFDEYNRLQKERQKPFIVRKISTFLSAFSLVLHYSFLRIF